MALEMHIVHKHTAATGDAQSKLQEEAKIDFKGGKKNS